MSPAERALLEARLKRVDALLATGYRDSADALLHAYTLSLLGRDSEGHRIFQDAAAAGADEPLSPDRKPLRDALLVLFSGRPKAAADLLDRAPGPEDSGLFAAIFRVELLVMAGEIAEANAALKELEQAWPSDPILPHTRGHLEEARADWEAALASYEEARRRAGDNPDLDEGIARALLELGRYEEADAVIARCREQWPGYAEILYVQIQRTLRSPVLGREELLELIEDYQAVSFRPDHLAEVAGINIDAAAVAAP